MIIKLQNLKKKIIEDQFKEEDLLKKVKEYDPQLHTYYLYSNLENDPIFFYQNWNFLGIQILIQKENVSRHIDRTLNEY